MAVMAQPPALQCSVAREETGSSLQIRGRLISQEDLQGKYFLQIRKAGPSGSSSVNQSGQFSASANQETFVGLATFNTEPGTSINITFSLQVGGRKYDCGSQDGGLH